MKEVRLKEFIRKEKMAIIDRRKIPKEAEFRLSSTFEVLLSPKNEDTGQNSKNNFTLAATAERPTSTFLKINSEAAS